MVYLGLGLAIKTGDFLTGAKRREWMGCWGCTSKSTSSQKNMIWPQNMGVALQSLGGLECPNLVVTHTVLSPASQELVV